MTRTSALSLVVLAVVGGGIGYAVEQVLTTTARGLFVPGWSLPVLLVILAVASLALAWPVRRSTHGGKPVNSQFAVMAVVFARAASLFAALFTGFGAGLLVFLLAQTEYLRVGSVVPTISLVIGGVLLVTAALVAEQFCTLPKDSDDREPDSPDT